MNKSKEAKFFCENCGTEVPQNARFCKKCGRFFSSVRCPVCGKSGRTDQFKNGCPHCGYAMKESANNKINKNTLKMQKKDDDLPAWIYGVTIVILISIIFSIYQYLRV
jgi:uncharacterized membrane protein YvbJ